MQQPGNNVSGAQSPRNPGPAQAGVRVEAMAMFRSGPLPTVQEFGGYEAVLPGAAERLMRQAEKMTEMAERQQTHRFGLENKIVDGNLKQQTEGARIGGGLSFVTIVGGIVLIAKGLPVAGLFGILGPLAVLAGIFAYGRSQNIRQLADKRAEEIVQSSQPPGTGVVRGPR